MWHTEKEKKKQNGRAYACVWYIYSMWTCWCWNANGIGQIAWTMMAPNQIPKRYKRPATLWYLFTLISAWIRLICRCAPIKKKKYVYQRTWCNMCMKYTLQIRWTVGTHLGCAHTRVTLCLVFVSLLFFSIHFFFARCSHLSERERDAITGSRLVCASVSAFFFFWILQEA